MDRRIEGSDQMKKVTKNVCLTLSLFLPVFLLFGCSTATKNREAKTDVSSENTSASQPEKKTNDTAETGLANKEEKSKPTAEEKNVGSDNLSEINEDHILSGYSSKEIEYARIWLELGIIKDPDELNVQHIPAGKPINPDDRTSVGYPEQVTQLAGSRLVDGSVTYSNHGNGTIKVYNVPLRWDGSYPAGEKFYENIILLSMQK
ncbi:hypothetical protein NIE88_17200 [Sporolactobacillus shoreicorticis]|uniref:Lipoprotein n=1 Tax=Sporolactobacillus shoreicorticis TaxID=1923877 RepID=A0ABW5S3L0_9BACL|nr:hypothetical protein [Sporolactobacillus shoreicorticis]MCO7127497.1 hypothetical protein [Sporolactobacillus shoreicorticis]